MAKIYVGIGCKGRIVTKVQMALNSAGFYNDTIDGDYGNVSVEAVKKFQTANGLAASGLIDDQTWLSLMGSDKPSIEDRCLQVTSSFEGHGFTKAHGNWDGAWLTWGIIGFTLKYGMVDKIILNVNRKYPELVVEAFGGKAAELIEVMKGGKTQKQAWADSISIPPKKYELQEPWKSSFTKFGLMDTVQLEQTRLAVENYFNPAKETYAKYNLKSEFGMGLCFDIHVQNGGVKDSADQMVKSALAKIAKPTELDIRKAIANAVAGTALPQFQEDVRSRKMTYATGSGKVHGLQYELPNWGFGEEAAF